MIEELYPDVTYPSSDARGLNENGDLVGETPINDVGHQRGWIYTVEHGVVMHSTMAAWNSGLMCSPWMAAPSSSSAEVSELSSMVLASRTWYSISTPRVGIICSASGR